LRSVEPCVLLVHETFAPSETISYACHGDAAAQAKISAAQRDRAMPQMAGHGRSATFHLRTLRDPKRPAATVGYPAGALISLMVAFARSYAT
jgi:hypothetical protein